MNEYGKPGRGHRVTLKFRNSCTCPLPSSVNRRIYLNLFSYTYLLGEGTPEFYIILFLFVPTKK